MKALKVKSVRAKRSLTQDMLTKMNRNILKQFRKINNKIDDTNTKINKIKDTTTTSTAAIKRLEKKTDKN